MPELEDPAGETERPGRAPLLARFRVDTRPLRQSRNFRNLWLGQAVSSFGNAITTVAMPFQVYELTHSTLWVGLLAIAALVPLLVVPLVGGAVADALDRRKLALGGGVALALVSGGLVANAALAHPRVWPIFALEAVGTAAWGFARPAMMTLAPKLVPDDQLEAAMALEGVYSNFAAVAGPAVGGVLIAAIGLAPSYGIDVATFSASLLALWSLPASPPDGEADRVSLAAIRDGLRFVRRTPELMGIFLVDTNAMIFGMPSALFPALALHYGGGARIVGVLYAAPYAGAFVAALGSGFTGHVRRQGLAVSVAAAVWGLAIAGVGAVDRLWPALGLLAVAGGADYVSAVLRSTILVRVTPDEMRGRMFGVELAQVAGAPSLGNLEAGVVASLTSVRVSIASGGIACAVGTVLVGLALPAFVRYDARERRAA
ncbi:MAG TPA: MFS transporter [Gaiellaceae bacterium]|nr:MFS transporter [Gaiellaceae bacterium]